MLKACIYQVGVPIKDHLQPHTDSLNDCKVIWSSTPTVGQIRRLPLPYQSMLKSTSMPTAINCAADSFFIMLMRWMVLHLWHCLRQVVKCASLEPTLDCTKLQLTHCLPSIALVTTNDPQFLLKKCSVVPFLWVIFGNSFNLLLDLGPFFFLSLYRVNMLFSSIAHLQSKPFLQPYFHRPRNGPVPVPQPDVFPGGRRSSSSQKWPGSLAVVGDDSGASRYSVCQ